MLLAALAALTSEETDVSDLLPMTCTTCGERCANRAESWIHTHSTGHRQFRSGARSAQDDLPCVCRSCGHRCANQAEAEAHGERAGHHSFRVEGRHCSHCAGFAARCTCREGCPKPEGAECENEGNEARDHCDHCRGRAGVCACRDGCPRPAHCECISLERGEAPARRNGHSFHGNKCGVCRSCGRCTFRITGNRPCMYDRGRAARERPRICGSGGGPAVCSACGVGPCCAQTPCSEGSRLGGAPKAAPHLQRERSGRTRGGNAQDNMLVEDTQLAEAIARSLESEGPVLQRRDSGITRREEEELDRAIAMSLAEGPQTPAPEPTAPPAPCRPQAPVAAAKATPAKAAAKASQVFTPPPRGAEPLNMSYEYIAACTENFAAERVLGQGFYGTVYYGTDATSEQCPEFAAKRLECADPQERETLERMTEAEVRVLTTFSHKNIIALLGCCLHPDGAILVYEFLSEGSLDEHLRSLSHGPMSAHIPSTLWVGRSM